MATFITVLENEMRSLSSEARRKYPALKDAAERGILKVCAWVNCKTCLELLISNLWQDVVHMCANFRMNGHELLGACLTD